MIWIGSNYSEVKLMNSVHQHFIINHKPICIFSAFFPQDFRLIHSRCDHWFVIEWKAENNEHKVRAFWRSKRREELKTAWEVRHPGKIRVGMCSIRQAESHLTPGNKSAMSNDTWLPDGSRAKIGGGGRENGVRVKS